MTNLAKSLATLVKYNGGFFKSEKQSKFLLNATDGLFVVSNSFNLGSEYNNKRVGGGSKTAYYLDDKGVYKVIKSNSKGHTVLFDRDCPVSMANNQKRLEASQARLERDKKAQFTYNQMINIRDFLECIEAHKKSIILPLVMALEPEELLKHPHHSYIKGAVAGYQKELKARYDALDMEYTKLSH